MTESARVSEVLVTDSFVLGAAVNDDDTLRENLESSPAVVESQIPLTLERGARSAASAYNAIIERTIQPYIIFVHQDVYLPMDFERQLCEAIEYLNSTDPNWAVLGVVGKDASGTVAGMAWSNGLQCRVGTRLNVPHQIVSIDELLIVLRRSSGLTFDDQLPGFHLYGTDIVLDAMEKGLSAYAINAPVVHNSVTVTHLDAHYIRAYRFMRKKWSHRLPLETLIVPVSRSLWPIFRSNLRSLKRCLRGLRPVIHRHPDPVSLAHQLAIEDER